MAQHDYSVANGTGLAVRTDINSLAEAIVSHNSGAAEPSVMFAYMFWADTTTGILKQRNAANTAWISLYTLANGILPNNVITDALLRDSTALSVIGRSANSSGDPADIAAGSDGDILRRSGTTLGFGSVVATKVTFSPTGNIAATDVQAAIAEVDTEKLALAGGTMTGNLVLNADPGSALHAATKQYVDGLIANVGKRQVVRVATTANITISTALNSGDALDGVTLANGDLVLVKNQSAPAENGIYVVGAVPARATFFDTYDEHAGSLIIVQEGTTNADTLWLCSANLGGTLDTTAINFTKMVVAGELLTSDIGTTVQAYSADLTTIAGLTLANDDFLQRKAGAWANRTIVQVKADLLTNLDTTMFAGSAFVTAAEGLASSDNDTSVASVAAIIDYVDAAVSSGVADGDKGDLTVSSGGTVWTVDPNVVSFSKMQDIASDRLIGRDTAASGDPEEITVGGGLEFTGSGGIQRSALTGDVTASAGSGSTTIANDAVSNAKMADMAEARIKGRASGAGTGDPTDLTGAQVSAIIDVTALAVYRGVPLSWFSAPTSNYATFDTRNNHPVYDFDTTTQETLYVYGVVPATYAGGGLTVTFWAAATSATSGTIGWDIAFENLDVQDLDADSFATAKTATATTVSGTSGVMISWTVSFSNSEIDGLAAGDPFRLRIRRDVATDTATGDAELLAASVKVEMT